MNKVRLSSKMIQRGCVTTSRENAQDMLDYLFNGIGYIFYFGSYWSVYTR